MEIEDDSQDGILHQVDADASMNSLHEGAETHQDPAYDSDSSDEQTVDRELSREPGHVSDSDEEDRDTRPAPPLLPTPQRASTPGRSLSPQAASSRPRGFLSITSPLRRQKSPQAHTFVARSISPMPSIQGVFATPAPLRATESTESSPQSAGSGSGSRIRTETSEETVVGDLMDENGAKDDDYVATDVEDGSGSESEDLDDSVVKITSADPRVAARAAAILKKVSLARIHASSSH